MLFVFLATIFLALLVVFLGHKATSQLPSAPAPPQLPTARSTLDDDDVSQMKLTYFDVKARGEAIRWALMIADIPFEDNRITFAQWADLKENTERIPYGSLPVLEIAQGGPRVAQSDAILKYVGKLGHLYPQDMFEAAQVDDVVAFMQEYMNKMIPIYFATMLFGKDEATKRKEEQEFAAKTLPYMLEKLERVIAANNRPGFCVGDRLTIADIQVAVLLEMVFDGMMNISPQLLEAYPQVDAVLDTVQQHPKIVAYLEA